jgi:DNA-binding PadR family transcriptional regulator
VSKSRNILLETHILRQIDNDPEISGYEIIKRYREVDMTTNRTVIYKMIRKLIKEGYIQIDASRVCHRTLTSKGRRQLTINACQATIVFGCATSIGFE